MIEFWVTAGIAAVFGTLTGAFVSVWSISRNIKHKSVIEERQKWRDTLRQLIPDFVNAKGRASRERVRDSIVLRLNPYKDQESMRLVDQFVSGPTRAAGSAVVVQFQDLLKRDWERAKIEASPWPWAARSRADRKVRAQMRKAGLLDEVVRK